MPSPLSRLDHEPLVGSQCEGHLRTFRRASQLQELLAAGAGRRRILEQARDAVAGSEGVVLCEHALGGEAVDHVTIGRSDAHGDGGVILTPLDGQHLELGLLRGCVEQPLRVAAARLAAGLGLGHSGNTAGCGDHGLNPSDDRPVEQRLAARPFGLLPLGVPRAFRLTEKSHGSRSLVGRRPNVSTYSDQQIIY
ncbi:MAG TPA: hypothetical protein VL481_00675 [Verrucomicrobiae bacterium]|nr:hypothetical protein [Verrucomicrobiae bacterium]